MKIYRSYILFIFFHLLLNEYVKAQSLKTEADISNKAINTTLEIGVVSGGSGVSQGGDANYTIPIFSPEGIRGMQPSVGISYSSGSGNGLLGFGWHLNAYSVISYDTKNLYNDNIVAPNYLGSSPYLLDGRRLINIATNEFRTESESFSKITYSTATQSFTVITKTGMTLEYGATSDSRSSAASGAPIRWYLKKSKDNLGNYIEYIYETQNDEKVLKKISYTKNDAYSTIVPNEITFDYELRSDINASYAMQASVTTVEPIYRKNRLKSILVKAEGENVRKYEFLYGSDGLYTYLNEVEEAGFDLGSSTAKKMNSTMFKYGTEDTPSSSTEAFTAPVLSGKKSEILTGDFNGDGLDDMFVAYYTQTGSYPKKYTDYKVYLRNSNSTGFGASASASGTFPQTTYWNGTSTGTVCSLYVELKVTDVDGNGKDDISIVKRGKTTPLNQRLFGVAVLYGNSTAASFSLTDYSSSMTSTYMGDIKIGNYFLTGDFDGDKRTDWITVSASDNKVHLHFPALNSFSNYIGNAGTINAFDNNLGCVLASCAIVKPIDFDGDGKDDIAFTNYSPYNSNCAVSSDLQTGVLTINKSYPVDEYVQTIVTSASLTFHETNGDFNGDGKADIFIKPTIAAPTSAYIRYATGANQTINHPFTLGESIDTAKLRSGAESFLVGDYNGDGKSDVLHYYLSGSTHNMVVYYSNGLAFKREANTFTFGTGYRPFAVADFNGDGRDDVIDTLANSTGDIQVVYFKPKSKEFLLTKVKDGFKRLTEFEYKLATGASGIYSYTNPTTNTYPLNTVVPVSYMVSKVNSPDGSGNLANTTSTEYTYADAISHLAGKGFLGFKTFKAKDNLTTVVSEQNNDIINNNTSFYIFGNTGSKTYYHASPSSLLTQQTPTYVIDDLTNKRHFLKMTKSVQKNFLTDIGQETNYTVNSDGNATTVEQKIFACTACSTFSVKQTTTTTINDFIVVSPSAVKSLPDVVTVTNNYAIDNYTNVTDYGYTNGLLSSKIDFANTTDKKVVTNYVYDAGANNMGLLTLQTVTPQIITNSVNSRNVSFEYFDNKRTLKKISANGLTTKEVTAYDKRFNAPTGVQDALYINYTNTTEYDAFGRVKKETQQPNNIETTNTYSFDASVSNGVYKVSTVTKALSNTPPTLQNATVWFDCFGHTIKTESDNISGTLIATTTYDAFGRTYQTTAPDASNAGANMTVTNNYDGVSNHFRLNNIQNSVTGTTQYQYFSPSDGENKVKITSSNSEYREQTTDATGRLKSSTDAAGTINYTYNAQGNTININTNGSITTMEFDAVTALQTSLIEPNSGTTAYTYNGYGELIKQQDAKSFQYEMTYDLHGRLKEKKRIAYSGVANTFPASASEEILTYEYKASGNAQQKLEHIKLNNVITKTYAYDTWHRPVSVTEKIDGTDYTTSTTYNSDNSVKSVTYPENVSFNYYYDAKGFLQYVKDATNTFNIYERLGANKYNAITQYKLGNGKTSNTSYNAAGGITELITLNSGTTYIQKLEYSIPNLQNGNITQRIDKTKAANTATDEFEYNNNLDQLKTIKVNGNTAGMITIGYDNSVNSNIASKTGVGTYSYDNTKKHALSRIEYSCSETLPLVSSSQAVDYTPFNKAAKITNLMTAGTYELQYTYGVDDERSKSVLKLNSNVQKTRYYVGNYEKEVVGTNAKHIYYINGGNGLCAIATKDNSSSSLTYYYVYTDHLGSILKLTDNTGTTVAEQSFDAWGRRRNPNNWEDFTSAGAATPGGTYSWLTRGYTGHEHADEVGLINMNGRMYDPVVGRMLSADKYVQDATNTQSYNRYTYCLNNPLKYTDPSGWIFGRSREYNLEPDINGGRGGSVNAEIFNNWDSYTGNGYSYNYSGPYSIYATNQFIYGFTYGTQTHEQIITAQWAEEARKKREGNTNTSSDGNEYNTTNPGNIRRVMGMYNRGNNAYDIMDVMTTSAQGIIVYGSIGNFRVNTASFMEAWQWVQDNLSNKSNVYPAVGPVAGVFSSIFSGVEMKYTRDLQMVEKAIAKRGKILKPTRSLKAAKSAAMFGKEASGAFGKFFTPLSAGLSIYDFGNAYQKNDNWGMFRAGCDFAMTFVSVACPVAGFIYFGATLTYDLYQMSKEP